jgi:hypothetical protein
VHEVSFFPTSLPTFVVCVLDGSRSNSSVFDLHFFYGQGCLIFLHVILAIWTSSFKKVLFSSFAHFFTWSSAFGKFSF